MKINFSNWKKWDERETFNDILFPGIYCLAITDLNLSDTPFYWIEEIKYFGMTNSRGGLKNRLRQFDDTIKGKRGHGGAARFRYKHEDHLVLRNRLYVSIQSFKCDVRSNQPSDLIIMGEVAKHEYDCFAEFVKRFNRLPEFNDKTISPKRK